MSSLCSCPFHRSSFTAAAVFTAIAAVLVPGSAAAQLGPVESPVRIEFSVNGGVWAPTGDLVEGGDITGDDLRMSESAAFGGGVGVLLPGGLGLEGQALFAPAADVHEVGSNDRVTEGDVLALTGNLIYRLPLPLVQPYLGAGAGIKRYTFDDPTGLGSDSESDFTGSLLAGAYIEIIPTVTIRAEARDYLSSFTDPRTDESKMQHDLAFLAGLSFRVP